MIKSGLLCLRKLISYFPMNLHFIAQHELFVILKQLTFCSFNVYKEFKFKYNECDKSG